MNGIINIIKIQKQNLNQQLTKSSLQNSQDQKQNLNQPTYKV